MAKRTGNPKIAIGYLRVSTDEQRLGPEAQRASIEAWAAREGLSVVAWHVDGGVSGATNIEERPASALHWRACGSTVLACSSSRSVTVWLVMS